ncbi:alginate O-acetyltransferase AlgF [Jannaschia sp. M317]|uniref:alginate O-acetyltransferase AlgF n=1 Tax=Jannaschia sp. M317 TaxID=2867011 RepID=UPI0021A44498|nr:alginate O-acetyltransferase AlgF [Jannaschia sp. M317]UWQ17947.1 alginate O-acetyltransferase AlgF [Jannaschia sp. M317]
MTTRRTLLATGLAATLIAAGPSLAGDEGLYEDVFDPQSSFIRVLAPDAGFASIDGTRVGDFTGGLSAYVNVMPGAIEVSLPGTATTVQAAPATHYTVVLAADGSTQVLTDALTLSPAKSDVSLYNLSSSASVDLFVPAARAVALAAVPAIGAKSVALKAPLTLDFDMRVGEQTLASVSAVELRRRAGVSFVLTGDAGGFSAVAVPNSYKR